MQFPESWLRSLVNPSIGTDELAHRLTMAGLEVEETEPAAPPFTGVVVTRIVDIAPHPDADKLRVCQVDDGSGALLQIVCGAPNAAAGLTVPLARVGAELPGGMKIGVAKMRGVQSSGMLCSARELGLSQDHAGLLELPAALRPGTDIRAALDLDDTLFTLKLTPNRADCLSILGVAREVAALTGTPLTAPAAEPVPVTIDHRLPVAIQAPDLCGRFAGRVIQGVNARRDARMDEDAPGACRPAFGVGPGRYFQLRHARGGASLACVRSRQDRRRSLRALGARRRNARTAQRPGRRAGPQGGRGGGRRTGGEPGRHHGRRSDLGDAGYAQHLPRGGILVARRDRRPRAPLQVQPEASHRFERGVDYASIPEHIELITRLILDICGGQAGPVDDQCVNLPVREPVRMRLARCHRVLGVAVERAEVAQIFTRLGLPFQEQGDDFVVTPPSYRFDIEIEEDLIEEVARVYGFERIPDVPPVARAKMHAQPEARRGAHAVRRLVAARDYQEVVNYSFVEAAWERDYAGNDNPVRLVNPIASHLSVMRSSLIAGLVAIVRHNANRKQSRMRLFELGRVFHRDPQLADGPLEVAGVRQPLMLAGVAWGGAVEEQWGVPHRQVDFYDVKQDIEALFGARADALRFVADRYPALHPGRSARIELDGQPIGWLGELHPQWTQQADLHHAPVVFELDFEALAERRLPAVRKLSRQPVVVRDLALWVDAKLPAQAMLDTVAAAIARDPQLSVVQDAQVFDVWREKPVAGQTVTEKSLAFRFWLQDTEVTLDEARVADCIARIKDALVAAHNARQRA